MSIFRKGLTHYITRQILYRGGLLSSIDLSEEMTRYIWNYILITIVGVLIIAFLFFFVVGFVFGTDRRLKLRNLQINFFLERTYLGMLLFVSNWNPFLSADNPHSAIMMSLVLLKYYLIFMNPLSLFVLFGFFLLSFILYGFIGSPVADNSRLIFEAKMISKNKKIDMRKILDLIKTNMVQLQSQIRDKTKHSVGILLSPNLLLTDKHCVSDDKEITINGDVFSVTDIEYDTSEEILDKLCILKLKQDVKQVQTLPISSFLSETVYGAPPNDGSIIESRVQSFDAEAIYTLNNTAPGDSGTPFFNERGDLIGLHCGSINDENVILPLWRFSESKLYPDFSRLKKPSQIFAYFDSQIRHWSGVSNINRFRS